MTGPGFIGVMEIQNKINYQKWLIDTLSGDNAAGRVPKILLHACCAPCASTCLETLDRFAEITVFFYNPNITEKEEYDHRLEELFRLVKEMPFEHNVSVMEGGYDPGTFFAMAEGLENEPERGRRCVGCYGLRLAKTAQEACDGGYDYFATTLTLSPLKPAAVINEIGAGIAENIGGIKYLPSDFKKNNGYLRSIELSKEYGLYRQNYCGCVFSKGAVI